MTLPRKRARIVLDGRAYRWVVARVEPGWAVIVQAASGPERALAVEVRCECEEMYWLADRGRLLAGTSRGGGSVSWSR